MAKYFFCNKFVNEMFLGCNIKNLFGSREIRFLYYVEKPLNFDPFGHAELSLLAKI